MIKKILFIVILFLLQSLHANSFIYSSIIGTSDCRLDSISQYVGSIDKVLFNGKEKDKVNNVSCFVYNNSDNSISISVKDFQVGSMPGSISYKFEKLSPDNFSSTQGDAIIFSIPILPDKKYDGYIEGSLRGDSLEYTIKTIDATYFGFSTDIETHFNGKLVNNTTK